jgi:hypothetical protein
VSLAHEVAEDEPTLAPADRRLREEIAVDGDLDPSAQPHLQHVPPPSFRGISSLA